jgi:putative component of membrane protein insertase Oxa1/YidC/SpoIIIJ protein YidD
MKKQIREVRVIDLVKYGILPPVLCIVIWLCCPLIFVRRLELNAAAIYTVAGIFTYFLAERFCIGLVLFYKVFAPLSVRDKCRFEPTCSTYMIMAINKYGMIIGIVKGVRRLFRCKPPNCGVDYP